MIFRFATPWTLGLLALVPLLALRHHLRVRPAAMRYAQTGLVRGLPRSWRVTWRPLLVVMRLSAVTLLILGLARPQLVQARETINGEGVDIALALDISGSMASLDFQPDNRLEASKQVISDFVEQRPYDKFGLVVFAQEAFNMNPLTLDHHMLDRSLGQVRLATDLGLDDGTAIGLGIANAANMLANSDAESKVIILLTDGVNNAGQVDPFTAAEAAKALGIRVYTVGAGRPGQVPVPVPGPFGGTQVVYQESALDEDTLRQVADITGGRYFRATDTAGLKAIYDEISELEKSAVEVQVFNRYQELIAWVLVPAAILLVTELVLRRTAFRTAP